jgi:hypothetical protein
VNNKKKENKKKRKENGKANVAQSELVLNDLLVPVVTFSTVQAVSVRYPILGGGGVSLTVVDVKIGRHLRAQQM